MVQQIAVRERLELDRRDRSFRGTSEPPIVRDRIVIVVDDGLATGSSMKAAVPALRRLHPASIVVGTPVGARATCDRLRQIADRVVCLWTPEPFNAVGPWYEEFTQTTDDEVKKHLATTAGVAPEVRNLDAPA